MNCSKNNQDFQGRKMIRFGVNKERQMSCRRVKSGVLMKIAKIPVFSALFFDLRR